nr:ABC transporter ATP-binding protein [Pullulanibacillus pueri]
MKIHFKLHEGLLKAVDGVDLSLRKKETLGIVGESGSGKSVTTQSILRIIPQTAHLEGEIILRSEETGKNINLATLPMNGKEIRKIRGGEISMIFQEPMKAFSPVHTIGNQMMETVLLHRTKDKNEAKEIVLQSLREVGMSNPEQRFDEYPHQLSGGMRQRAMIAMALASNPAILIADEPTTALDVTLQAQVLELMNNLKEKTGTSIIFITHDLGVIAEMSDNVAVMYLGQVMEYTDVDTLFHGAKHPYTLALLKSMPSVGAAENKRLEAIEGNVPTPINLPKGCRFFSRCKLAQDGVCNVQDIPLVKIEDGHYVRCVLVDEKNRGGR